jgi:hypothetical protein
VKSTWLAFEDAPILKVTHGPMTIIYRQKTPTLSKDQTLMTKPANTIVTGITLYRIVAAIVLLLLIVRGQQ